MIEAIKNNPIIYLVLKTWQYSQGNRPRVILYILLASAANCISLGGPLIVATLVNKIQQSGGIINGKNVFSIYGILGLFLLLTLITWSFHGPSRIMEMTNGFLTRANYKIYLFNGTVTLPLKWHGEHHSGDLLDKMSKGTTGLGDFAESTFELIKIGAHLIGSYVILTYFNPHSAYIVLGTTFLAAMIIVKFDKVLVRQYYELNRTENRIAERITDAVNNIETVIILRIEQLIGKSIAQKIMSSMGLFVKNNRLNEIKWFLTSFCASISKVLVLGSFIYIAYKSGQPILIGSFVALHGYVNENNDLFFEFASIYNQIIRGRTRVANSEEISRDFGMCHKSTNGRLPRNWKELRIENLSFSYHDDENEGKKDLHLDNISMTINRGQRIALMGARGSGKTTFLKLVGELYRPSSVTILVDGHTLPQGFTSISSDTTLVPQNPQIFHASILANVTMGVDYETDHVLRFVNMARFGDVAARLPRGLDSWIHERGVNLSGGERQSLALARGLLASDDKEIVLLDEPTSSVDTINELEIHRNIFREFQGKTIISSLHKLHLLPLFDIIYFFKDGRIIDSGTFEELLDRSEEFQKIWIEYNRTFENSSVPTR